MGCHISSSLPLPSPALKRAGVPILCRMNRESFCKIPSTNCEPGTFSASDERSNHSATTPPGLYDTVIIGSDSWHPISAQKHKESNNAMQWLHAGTSEAIRKHLSIKLHWAVAYLGYMANTVVSQWVAHHPTDLESLVVSINHGHMTRFSCGTENHLSFPIHIQCFPWWVIRRLPACTRVPQ